MKMDKVCCPYQDPIFKKPLAEENTNWEGEEEGGRRVGLCEGTRVHPAYTTRHFKGDSRKRYGINPIDAILLSLTTVTTFAYQVRQRSLYDRAPRWHTTFPENFFVTTSRAMCHTCCQTGHIKMGVGMLLFFIWTGICVSDLDILPMFPAPLEVEFQKSTFRRPCGPI